MGTALLVIACFLFFCPGFPSPCLAFPFLLLWIPFHLTFPALPLSRPPPQRGLLSLLPFRECLEATPLAETAASLVTCVLSTLHSYRLQNTCFCKLENLTLYSLASKERAWEMVINLFPYIDGWVAAAFPALSRGGEARGRRQVGVA